MYAAEAPHIKEKTYVSSWLPILESKEEIHIFLKGYLYLESFKL